MSISEICVKKPVTTLLCFFMAIALGIYCTFNLPMDMYPNMTLPYVLVYTTYNDAGPEEVEQSITRTMESVLSGLSGLKNMTSKSSMGASIIFLEFDYGVNLDVAGGDIRDKIDMIRGYLPESADAPVVIKIDPSMMPIMFLSLEGERTPEELRQYAEDVISKRLEQLDGVASANVIGGREKSINIDIPRDRLEAYGLSITSVAQMIGAQNIQSSGGRITSGDTNYTIKTNGKYKTVEDLKDTVITYKVDMLDAAHSSQLLSVRLRDIADVYEGYKSESTLAYLDSRPCVMILIQKQSGKNSVATGKRVRAAVKKLEKEMPSDIHLQETNNTVDIINETINNVVMSVVQGAFLAILILFIFLRSIKSTIIIGLAIPISVMVTLLFMYFNDITINMISMAGLLLGIGMLVDNSIVILENIYAYRQRDAKPTVAAILGSKEMVASITSSTLTSVCIFLPMILFKKQLGMMGQMFNDLSFTIIFSLMSSLIVAVALVPVLCSSILRIDKIVNDEESGIGYAVNNAFNRFFLWLENSYAGGVSKVLHHRKLCVWVLVVVFILSMAAIKFVGFIFMPSSASNSVSVEFTLPQGTDVHATEDTIFEMYEMTKDEIKGTKFISMQVGGTSIFSSGAETNKGSITYTLYPEAERLPGYDNEAKAKEKLRKYFNKFPGADLKFGTNQNNASSGKMEISIKCDDLDNLRNTASFVENLLKEKGGDYVNEVESEQEDGLPQAEIVVDRAKMYEMGLTIYNVGSEINAAINGKTATRYTDKGKDIDVIVQLSEKDRKKLNDLDQISVVNSQGQRIPLSSFAHYEQNLAPVTILRKNQTRTITIKCSMVEGISMDVAYKNIQRIVEENLPRDETVIINYGGDMEEMIRAVKGFAAIMLMAAALVFVVMASQFESLVDPFIVILTIPLSFIGVMTIYALTGNQLSIVSIMGMLVLIGTIVNNGIVLVDYTNLLRKRGLELEEACVEAARNRLRPILMSTLTTVISLLPMAFFATESSRSMQPIGLTVFGGMTFGSLMTLFLMPSIYFMINSRRIKKAEKKALKKAKKQADLLEKLGREGK
ncbi:efflux RND transporter permease subunit [Treponema sp.]|uniref:efflux RND transporter permease subunit n=1 Tax=Treponema sp. TaxID=166 RepID=UPI0038909DDE